MSKLIETMTPEEQAALLIAVSKVLEVNKAIGNYSRIKYECTRVLSEILKSIN